MTDSIFLSIPTMNDKEYLNTVERALDLSSNSKNVSIGTTIFYRSNDFYEDNTQPFFLHFKNYLDNKLKLVKYDILPFYEFSGVGQGRVQPLKHYSYEKYYLSLDSHTDFVDGWDELCIDMYESSREHFGKKRLLTTYLPGYSPYSDDLDKEFITPDGTSYSTSYDGRWTNSKGTTIYRKGDKYNLWPFFSWRSHQADKMVVNGEHPFTFPMPCDKNLDSDEDSRELIFKKLINNQFLPGKKISAHFTFTEADPWVTKYKINLDEKISFWAEEFYQSSLAYARGYNFVWFKDPVAFHHYRTVFDSTEKDFRGYDKKDLNTMNDDEKISIYYEYLYNHNIQAYYQDIDDNLIINNLLNKKYNFGYTPRDINSFSKYSKLDFKTKKESPWLEVPELNVITK